MKILLVSNMYPDDKYPSYGIFVKRFEDEIKKIGVEYDKSVMIQQDNRFKKLIGYVSFYMKTFFRTLIENYDVVYIHYASYSSIPVLAANYFRKFKIYTNVHGSDVVPENRRQKTMQKYTRLILKKSDRIIVPSEYFKNYVKQKYELSEARIFVYPSAGIDRNIFFEIDNKKIELYKKKFKINNGLPTFGMAGRISAGKGWDTFVEAILELKKDGVNANFIIIGSGNETNKLIKIIKENKLDNDIACFDLLPQEQLCIFYNIIDYFVFPTKREGESLGLVAIEAMACGTPVIASDFAAPKYYVENDVNGFKFQVNSSHDLAEIIKKSCDIYRNELYENLHDGALNTANKYMSDAIIKNLKNILKINLF